MNLFLELLVFFVTLLYSYLEAFVKLFVPVRRKSLSGELVLITGAGHGSGTAVHGCVSLCLLQHGVEETAAECQKLGATVQTLCVDCSKREEIYSTTTRAFLHPFMVAYVSDLEISKFAAVGFHRALTEELSTLGKDGIKTTCLCPVFINTGFVKNPRARLGKILEVEEVVEALMEGIVTNQKMVFVPPQLNMALLSEMVFPERALNTLKKLAIPTFDAVIGQRSTQ
uniref:17beta-estradiol 17-dehydrogenase n=1 Tax=Malurus cyaneus samueli TaxID=2593467 RepID=A0A8C5UCK4_9PASS